MSDWPVATEVAIATRYPLGLRTLFFTEMWQRFSCSMEPVLQSCDYVIPGRRGKLSYGQPHGLLPKDYVLMTELTSWHFTKFTL